MGSLHIGVCRLSLRLPSSRSLKNKRQVAQSLIAALRSKYNVSVAEVEDNDRWQVLTIGISCVSNDRRHVDEILSKVESFVGASRPDLEMLDSQVEIISGV